MCPIPKRRMPRNQLLLRLDDDEQQLQHQARTVWEPNQFESQLQLLAGAADLRPPRRKPASLSHPRKPTKSPNRFPHMSAQMERMMNSAASRTK
jgi:hypothetical protein